MTSRMSIHIVIAFAMRVAVPAGGGAGGWSRWPGGRWRGWRLLLVLLAGRGAGSLEQFFVSVQTGVWLALWGNFWRPNRNKTK